MEILFHRSLSPVIQTARDLSSASDVYLLYTAFAGDVELNHNRRSILSRFGWVPLLNLVMGLPRAVEAAISDGAARYSFTESDSYLSFRRTDGGLEIGASFSKVVLRAAVDELREALNRFRESALRHVRFDHPELAHNRYFLSSFAGS